MTILILGKIIMATPTMAKLEMIKLTMNKINMVKLTILWWNQP